MRRVALGATRSAVCPTSSAWICASRPRSSRKRQRRSRMTQDETTPQGKRWPFYADMERIDIMKAAIFYGGHDIRLEDLPQPEPGPDEVLFKVLAAGICGSDLHL